MKIKDLTKTKVPLSQAILIALVITLSGLLLQAYIYDGKIKTPTSLEDPSSVSDDKKTQRLQEEVLPKEGVDLGIKWDDIAKDLVEIGVIDKEKMLSLFNSPKEKEEYEKILSGNYNKNIKLTAENSRFILNTFWAFGLAQNSDALTTMQENYDQVANLAATGGWTLGKDDPMTYYNKHTLVKLTKEQQEKVIAIAENIYRPCCNNHTTFADCNHGMALLGLIELMIANNYSENDIYALSLKINSMWFPDTYLTLASFVEDTQDTSWKDVDPKQILGKDYSSASGYRSIVAQTQPVSGSQGGGGCGV